MIVKSLSRKTNISQLVEYLFAQTKTTSTPLIITHNLKSKTIPEWVAEFSSNEKYRLHPRSNGVKIYHTILSFAAPDTPYLAPESLIKIAKKFIALRGRESIYLGTAHYDRGHVHLHIIMSGTKYKTGEANRISKQDFLKLKQELDRYQREYFPKLIHSLPIHTPTSNLSEQHTSYLSKNHRGHLEQLTSMLTIAYSKAISLSDFINQIELLGYKLYYRNSHVQGILHEGKKYRLSTLGYKPNQLQSFHAPALQTVIEELSAIRSRSASLSNIQKGRER